MLECRLWPSWCLASSGPHFSWSPSLRPPPPSSPRALALVILLVVHAAMATESLLASTGHRPETGPPGIELTGSGRRQAGPRCSASALGGVSHADVVTWRDAEAISGGQAGAAAPLVYTIRCLEGFLLEDGGGRRSRDFTCEAGVWRTYPGPGEVVRPDQVVAGLRCGPVKCRRPPGGRALWEGRHMVSSGTEAEYGARVLMTCVSGYSVVSEGLAQANAVGRVRSST